MKTFSSKILFFAGVCLIALASCHKNPLMPNKGGEIQFTQLTADNTALASGATTKVTATVQNACPEISYDWSSSSGVVNGTGPEIIFNAPSSPSQITVTCTVNHTGKQSRTKSINITVQ